MHKKIGIYFFFPPCPRSDLRLRLPIGLGCDGGARGEGMNRASVSNDKL